jgi:hypothetical protein
MLNVDHLKLSKTGRKEELITRLINHVVAFPIHLLAAYSYAESVCPAALAYFRPSNIPTNNFNFSNSNQGLPPRLVPILTNAYNNSTIQTKDKEAWNSAKFQPSHFYKTVSNLAGSAYDGIFYFYSELQFLLFNLFLILICVRKSY